MPARASERPGRRPGLPSCEVAQPPKPSAAEQSLPEPKMSPGRLFFKYLNRDYLLTTYLRVGDIFDSGRISGQIFRMIIVVSSLAEWLVGILT